MNIPRLIGIIVIASLLGAAIGAIAGLFGLDQSMASTVSGCLIVAICLVSMP